MKRFLALTAAITILSGCCDKSRTITLTEPLEQCLWEKSEWISVKDAPVVTDVIQDGSRAADGASWFVCEVIPSGKVAKATWMTAGLGVYQLYVNGEVECKEVLKPGFTHHEKTKISYTYDITDAFVTKAGKVNVLSAQVTPGWWADKIITPAGNEGMIGRKCAFRGVLELEYTDGTKEYFGTDTLSWKAGIAGPVKHAAIFDGEIYDARISNGYKTPELLSTPEINTEFKGVIVPTEGAEIYLRKDLSLKPAKAYTWKGVSDSGPDAFGKVNILREYAEGESIILNPGENLVIDFGQNCAGVPSFKFKAAEGTTLRCEVSELLNDGNGLKSRGMDGPEGSIHRLNLRIPEIGMYLEYTFAGKGKVEEYLPRCTFFGFRLIGITCDAPVEIISVESVPVSSIGLELETGKITTGNEDINKLISNTYWGQLSNYLSVPTDCPQRNERLGWTADTQVFTETGSFFANTRNFFHKWMRDMRDSQGERGGFPGVAPLAQYGNECSRVGWSDAGVICPWTIWKQFGDKSIVDESWESMEKYLDYLAETKFDHNAMLADNGNYQWADWLSYEDLESCTGKIYQDFPEAIKYWNYLCASYWLIDAGMMADMASATGRDAAKYEKMADDAKDYIRTQFMNEDGSFKQAVLNTMQTPALFALKNGIVEGEAKDAMIARLRENFEAKGNRLQTGFLGTSILLPTLSANGMSDIAYKLLFQRENPSWLYSVDNGATTIWERWNSYMVDEGMGPQGMNSFNHYAYGVVCEWIWETAAGIESDPAEPGFKHIIMKPVPDKNLVFLDATYNSASGQIKSSWKYEGDEWIWTFTIPEGCHATVTLPGQSESVEYTSGTYTIRHLP